MPDDVDPLDPSQRIPAEAFLAPLQRQPPLQHSRLGARFRQCGSLEAAITCRSRIASSLAVVAVNGLRQQPHVFLSMAVGSYARWSQHQRPRARGRWGLGPIAPLRKAP